MEVLCPLYYVSFIRKLSTAPYHPLHFSSPSDLIHITLIKMNGGNGLVFTNNRWSFVVLMVLRRSQIPTKMRLPEASTKIHSTTHYLKNAITSCKPPKPRSQIGCLDVDTTAVSNLTELAQELRLCEPFPQSSADWTAVYTAVTIGYWLPLILIMDSLIHIFSTSHGLLSMS